MEYLNFSEISKIPFKDVLDYLGLPYSSYHNGEIRGEGFIINPEKNLYFNPKGDDKGSVINFLAKLKSLDLRAAAQELKKQFLTKEHEPTREIPNLELSYCKKIEELGLTEETCAVYEVGLVKQRSIMSGKIAFKVYDHSGNHIGYVGYNFKNNDWFYPKGFKKVLYNYHTIKDDEIFVTVGMIDCLKLIQNGKLSTVALMGTTMTKDQEELLLNFKLIHLVHKDPLNIISRLSVRTFVKSYPDLTALL